MPEANNRTPSARISHNRYVFWFLIGWLGASMVAWGQTDLDRFERQLEQIRRATRLQVDTTVPVEQRTLLDYGGFFTSNFLAIDDPDQVTHVLRQQDLNAYLRMSVDGVHEFFLRASTRHLDFNAGDDFNGLGDDWIEPTLDRAHYTFDLNRYHSAYEGQTLPYNVVVQTGRQLVHWANGLTLSQEIDGGIIQTTYDTWAADIVAGITRDSTVDIDSSRPDFNGDTKRVFAGALISKQISANHKPYIYGLVQRDRNDDDFAVIGGIPSRFDYDSWYLGVGANGNMGDRLLYGVELVYEGGETLSDPLVAPQRHDAIEAVAADVKFDFLLTDPNKTRLSLEFVVATGDDDRSLHTTNTFGGNAPGTADHAFNAFGLINTGLAFGPNVSNLFLVRGGASTFPLPSSNWFKQLQVGTNVFIFNKLESNAPIDEPTSDARFIGIESDVYANWQITSDVSMSVRYGLFAPGKAIRTDKDARHFFFTGLTYAF